MADTGELRISIFAQFVSQSKNHKYEKATRLSSGLKDRKTYREVSFQGKERGSNTLHHSGFARWVVGFESGVREIIMWLPRSECGH